MEPNLSDDFRDLHDALEQVFLAEAREDVDACAKAAQNVLALIESLAVLHCNIHNKVLASRRDSLRKMGCQEVFEPIRGEAS